MRPRGSDSWSFLLHYLLMQCYGAKLLARCCYKGWLVYVWMLPSATLLLLLMVLETAVVIMVRMGAGADAWWWWWSMRMMIPIMRRRKFLQDVKQCCLCDRVPRRCVVYWVLEHKLYSSKLNDCTGHVAKPGGPAARHHSSLNVK